MNSMNGANEKRESDEEKDDGERRVEKESQMFSAKQGQSTRVLLGSFQRGFACVRMRKRARMTAQRACVHGFKNCAPPSLLLGRGKQTAVSARRSRKKEK